MRNIVLGSVLLFSVACSTERGLSPAAQPQKSALLLCPASRPVCDAEPPLLFVDGKRMSWEGPGDLNPGEIESVEVVKGAAAVSRYGAEAKNGVVYIVTKKQKH